MSESKGDTASSASERPNKRDTVLTLTTARNMLPLVRRIVGDIVVSQHNLTRLQTEEDRLFRQRHTLTWPERSRRYQVREELATGERELQKALAEIETLGVSLLDPLKGRIGFPTIVNGRRAFFSWQPGEEALRHWHFASETAQRPIPSSWFDAVKSNTRGKS